MTGKKLLHCASKKDCFLSPLLLPILIIINFISRAIFDYFEIYYIVDILYTFCTGTYLGLRVVWEFVDYLIISRLIAPYNLELGQIIFQIETGLCHALVPYIFLVLGTLKEDN